MKQIDFLPMSLKECRALGWDALDVILITGDAYIDHPSFGAAIIGRYLVANGYRVGIISQPNWRTNDDFLKLGRPLLFFGITSGNMDSMINHYTAQKKIRSDDAYSPDGKAGLRPDRATNVYTQKVKQLFKGVPVVLGGIEASLRRLPHYDYWSDKVKNSILLDSKADIILYGMSERGVLKVADYLAAGNNIKDLQDLPGSVVATSDFQSGAELLPDAEDVLNDKMDFLEMNRQFMGKQIKKTFFQKSGLRFLRHNPPERPSSTEEMDAIYALPFSREPHPSYKGKTIPAFEQIKESITAHRGCFGGCHFCALHSHQGKYISSRSEESIISEIEKLLSKDYFKGIVSDIGGPSANMYKMECKDYDCERLSCLMPTICPKLPLDHKPYRNVLSKANRLRGVKNIFISSGIRTDLALKDRQFIKEVIKHYTGGRLKLAPEHNSPSVLKLMNKPTFDGYEEYVDLFVDYCEQNGIRHSITPYIIVGHPGTTLNDAIDLAVYLRKSETRLRQVQEFTPTPMTISSVMYHTGLDFYTKKKIYVPKGRDVRIQKALLQWFVPENKKYVVEALREAGRRELYTLFFG